MSNLQNAQDHLIEIESEDGPHEHDQEELQMIEAEQFLEELQQNSQKLIEKMGKEEGEAIADGKLTVIKNPISPYMMFVKSWKTNHPEEKFNMSALGQIWRNMSLSEKQPFEAQYREKRQQYDEYQANLQIHNPNQASNEPNAPKYLFPLARVRSIMRQDSFYAPKVEATAAMAKATEYFAEYILEETKKLTEGQSRIDAKALFDCINNNRSLSFLQCLIEEYNKESAQPTKDKKTKPNIRLQFEQPDKKVEKTEYPTPNPIPNPKPIPQPKPKTSSKPASLGQMSLDSFVFKQR